MRSKKRIVLSLTAATLAVAVVASVLVLTGGSSPQAETQSEAITPSPSAVSDTTVVEEAEPPEQEDPEPSVPEELDLVPQPTAPDVDDSPEPAATPAPAAPAPQTDLTIVVDETARPSVAEVEGLEDGDAPRPTGRLMTGEGDVSDVVLDELIVSAASEAEIDAMAARWNGTVVDRFPTIPDDPRVDALVRVDPATADIADVQRIAADLSAVEPHAGQLLVGGERTLRLLSIMAAEAAQHGTIVTLNPLEQAETIADGVVQEAEDQPNVFTWSYMQGGGVQDFAVAPAWQLLAAHGQLDTPVRVLVNDGGFSSNPDFPTDVTLRYAKWGDPNRTECADSECAYHGTHVLLTMAAAVDNGYGTAGVAGPLDPEVIAVALYNDKWKVLRRLADMVDQYRPAVVNMSYVSVTTAGRAAAQDIFDRRYRQMTRTGALLFGGAGNEGLDIDQRKCVGSSNCFDRRLVFPCESAYVMCVGGLESRTTDRHPSSNFGAEDNRRSVEIWGPWTAASVNDPENAFSDTSTGNVGGTSIATPFVAGVAALVKAANPDLGPEEIRTILNETANVGVGGGTWITGSLRRVDALAAVAAALDVDVAAPTVRIDFPNHGSTYPVSEWLQLDGAAVDFAASPLPIVWTSSIDGELSNGAELGPVGLGALSVGTHVLTASATDNTGQTGSAQVTFEVTHRPPEVVIEAPGAGANPYTHQILKLRARTADPDNFWSPLPDGDVVWTIRAHDSEDVIWSVIGHEVLVPPDLLTAGTYRMTVKATSPGGTAEASTEVTYQELPPGEDLPEVHVTSPGAGLDIGVGSGGTAALDGSGSATDAQDGPIAGTRMRWVARSGDTELVLCTGSEFDSASAPAPAPEPAPEPGLTLAAPTGDDGPAIGGLVAVIDCADTSFSLPVPPGAPNVKAWDVVLQARDSSGLIGESLPVVVGVHAAIG